MDAREPPRRPPTPPPPLPALSGGVVSPGHGQAMPHSGSVSTVAVNSIGVMHGLPLQYTAMAGGAMKPADAPGLLYHGDSSSGTRPAGAAGLSGEQVKKKRGRPRKYGPDGSIALTLNPMASSGSGYSGGAPGPDQQAAKRKGRPPGSSKKRQLDALGTPGTSFTPHVVTVKPGEDVASKITAFSQQGPRTVCILSATGTLSTVALHQPASSGGIVTLEGRFEILSLSGSSVLAEDGNTRSRTGGMSVALLGCDNRVIGGSVAGVLMASSYVQVVLGSFVSTEGRKPKPEAIPEAPKHETQMAGFGAPSEASLPSEGTSNEHSDNISSPSGRNGSPIENSNPHFHSTFTPSWHFSQDRSRYDPD